MMADAVIDLDAMCVDAHAGEGQLVFTGATA